MERYEDVCADSVSPPEVNAWRGMKMCMLTACRRLRSMHGEV